MYQNIKVKPYFVLFLGHEKLLILFLSKFVLIQKNTFYFYKKPKKYLEINLKVQELLVSGAFRIWYMKYIC